jgi:hypothetical protein
VRGCIIIHEFPIRQDRLNLCAIVDRCAISQFGPIVDKQSEGNRNQEFRVGSNSKQRLTSARVAIRVGYAHLIIDEFPIFEMTQVKRLVFPS